ncbi:hypothetical protein [Desulfosporosinus metallidurans]|uniref:Uncharacterized protein n=1 Tax=Desulfosporosinus metallidurans TaxID=1888891 RepID=A0A1Q8QFQ6_9FIRM|nr:hypothetical protein [Desulfosporosinus metallidurans]OLN26112.1 hypothetical protein DSOL_5116 [Desulfosporosinus metallidurans]
MQKRQLNDGLLNRQEEKRLASINKVQAVIQQLRDEGYSEAQITLPKIVEWSMQMPDCEISRALLDKKHIVDVLKKEGVGPYVRKVVIRQNPEKIEKELEKAKSTIERLQALLQDEKRKKETLRIDLETEKEKSSALRAMMQEMYIYASNLGVDLQLVIDNPKFQIVK